MEVIVILLLIALLVALETILYSRYGPRNISYSISLSTNEAYEGDEIEVVEEIYNGKRLPMPWLKSEISTSRWLDFIGTEAAKKDELRFVPSVFSLKPYQKCTRKWRVKCLKRGVFELNNTSLLGSDLFGLADFSYRLKCSALLTVLPVALDTDDIDTAKQSLYGDTIVKRFICPDPFYVSGSREYTGSEPLHSIHWKNSARQNELMTYNNDFTTDANVLVLLNMQRSSGMPVPMRFQELETLIKAAAHVIDRLHEQNLSFAFAASGSLDNYPFLNSGNGSEHLYTALRLLSELENECNVSLSEFIEHFENLQNYTDIILLTSSLNDDTLSIFNSMNSDKISVYAIINETQHECSIVKIPKIFTSV